MAKKAKGQVAETLQEAPQEASQAPKVELADFDTWYAARHLKIPQQHRKEVLKADFRGRGLKEPASMQDYDEALQKYGVKLS